MTDWPEVALGDHVELVPGFPFKSARYIDSAVSAVRLLRGDNVAQGILRWDGAKHWPEAECDNYSAFELREGDVVLAMDRPWIEAGLKYAWVQPSDLPCLLVQRVARMRGTNGLSTAFLRYVIGSPSFVNHVKSITTGVNVPHISGKDIKRFRFSLPPRSDQDRIASILGAYDDLIEVNRRRIALLEEMARQLFEEWFVHFRFPGHERSAMEGGRPEGWQQLTLSELADVRLGKMLDAAKNRGELRPYLANINVRWGSFALSELRSMRFEPDEAEKYGLAYGDIVMCEGGEPGRCAMWKGEAPQMMLQKALHRIRSKSNMDRNYLFHYLLFSARSKRLSGLFTGSTIKHLPLEKLLNLRVEVPSSRLLKQFGKLVTPIEAQVGTLQAVNRKLLEMREILLPRLVSGELPVPAAARELEAAA